MKDHPLFPPRGDEPHGREVAILNVTRWDLRKGKFLWCKTNFAPEELIDLENLFEMFGGGDYELVGKLPNGHVSDRVKYELPGRPKPLNEEDDQEEGQAVVAPVAMPPPMPMPGDGAAGVLAMAITMTREAQSNLTTMLTGMLAQERENTRQFMALMQQNQAAAMQAQGQLMNTTLEIMRNSKPDSADGVMKGLEMGVELARGATEAAQGAQGSGEPTLTEVLEGAKAVAGMMGNNGGAQVASAAPRHPVGMPRPPAPRPMAAPAGPGV